MIVTFHIDEQVYDRKNDNHRLDFYQKYFENQFLNDTADFYRVKAKIYLQQNSVMDYLRKILSDLEDEFSKEYFLQISDYLHEETDRITSYLHSSTLPKLTNTLENILIHDQLPAINDEAQNLIRDEKIEGRTLSVDC